MNYKSILSFKSPQLRDASEPYHTSMCCSYTIALDVELPHQSSALLRDSSKQSQKRKRCQANRKNRSCKASIRFRRRCSPCMDRSPSHAACALHLYLRIAALSLRPANHWERGICITRMGYTSTTALQVCIAYPLHMSAIIITFCPF